MTNKTKFVSVAVTLGVACALLSPSARASAIFGRNVVANGDAEVGPGVTSDVKAISVPDWTVNGGFDVIQYGASGGFPDDTSPGPKDRGKNFFYGGPGTPRSTATQSISLNAYSVEIATGALTFTLSAYLGGYEGQRDNATLIADFKGLNGGVLKHVVLGPVTPADRKSVTGLFPVSASGAVPTGARSVSIELVMTRYDGGDNDGSADNVSLILRPKS